MATVRNTTMRALAVVCECNVTATSTATWYRPSRLSRSIQLRRSMRARSAGAKRSYASSYRPALISAQWRRTARSTSLSGVRPPSVGGASVGVAVGVTVGVAPAVGVAVGLGSAVSVAVAEGVGDGVVLGRGVAVAGGVVIADGGDGGGGDGDSDRKGTRNPEGWRATSVAAPASPIASTP